MIDGKCENKSVGFGELLAIEQLASTYMYICMYKIYLNTRNPAATPKARTHIPMSNGGQLEMKENKTFQELFNTMQELSVT